MRLSSISGSASKSAVRFGYNHCITSAPRDVMPMLFAWDGIQGDEFYLSEKLRDYQHAFGPHARADENEAEWALPQTLPASIMDAGLQHHPMAYSPLILNLMAEGQWPQVDRILASHSFKPGASLATQLMLQTTDADRLRQIDRANQQSSNPLNLLMFHTVQCALAELPPDAGWETRAMHLAAAFGSPPLDTEPAFRQRCRNISTLDLSALHTAATILGEILAVNPSQKAAAKSLQLIADGLDNFSATDHNRQGTERLAGALMKAYSRIAARHPDADWAQEQIPELNRYIEDAANPDQADALSLLLIANPDHQAARGIVQEMMLVDAPYADYAQGLKILNRVIPFRPDAPWIKDILKAQAQSQVGQLQHQAIHSLLRMDPEDPTALRIIRRILASVPASFFSNSQTYWDKRFVNDLAETTLRKDPERAWALQAFRKLREDPYDPKVQADAKESLANLQQDYKDSPDNVRRFAELANPPSKRQKLYTRLAGIVKSLRNETASKLKASL